jgi:hypothetical protein
MPHGFAPPCSLARRLFAVRQPHMKVKRLAAFGEKEHHAAIAGEALSLFSCLAPRRKASTHKGSAADSPPKASTQKGSTADSPPKGSTQKGSTQKGSTQKGSTTDSSPKGSPQKGPTADSSPKASTHKGSTADFPFYSTGCWHLYFLLCLGGADGTLDSCPRNCITSLVPTWHQSVQAEPIIHQTISDTLFSRVKYFFGRDRDHLYGGSMHFSE